MGTFDGLSVALSSLYAQRRGLDVAGQNIANVNTEGYTRQRVLMRSIGAPAVPAIFSTWSGGGGGVQIDTVERLRDVFLEARALVAHADYEQTSVTSQALGRIEGVFNEPGEDALQSILSDFWSGFDSVSNTPGDLAARSQLLQRASSLTDWLNQAADQLSVQWSASRNQLGETVTVANTTAASIAALNQAIMRGTQADLPVNELADQRDQLIMKLSQSLGATTKTGANGQINVLVGGVALVDGTTVNPLQVAGPLALHEVAPGNGVALQWAKDSSPVQGSGGQAAALTGALNGLIPTYSARLDSVATAVATAVNTQHALGYDLAGTSAAPPATAFFVPARGATITAATIGVGITDPSKVAASGVASAGGNRDGSNADKLAALASASGGPDELYRRLVVDLGVQGQSETNRLNTQKAIVQNVDNARDAQAGVSLDEEMSNLLLFQHAYEAAARLMTTVDSTLDTLVNRTGLVGR